MTKVNIFRSSVGKYFLILSIFPIILLCVLLSYYMNKAIKDIKQEDMEHLLSNSTSEIFELYNMAADGNFVFSEEADGVYLGDVKLSGDYELVDMIKEKNGVEATVFFGDTRIVTTIKNDDGSRYVATKATDIWEGHASNGEAYFTDNVKIDNGNYYGYYEPVFDKEEKPVGMIFAGISSKDVNRAIKKSTNKVIRIAIVFCIVAVSLSVILYNNIVSVQNEALEYVQEIDAGILNHRMNPKLLKRKDEYGMMCRYYVKLNNSLIKLIQKDALTGLNNRRDAIKVLEGYIREANSVGGSTFCVAICDIDFFKKVNDTYGHNCGDEVLKMVAEKLSHISDEGGYAARWGGEEFLLAMRGKRKDFLPAVNKVFEEIRSTSVEFERQSVNVTVTVGLSEYIPPAKLDVVISNADLLLYKGKNNGRNQIVT